jgi:NhaP-type Na+/H+ or K+/H+ antiporter
VHFLDENLIIDREAVSSATIHFLVVAFGSVVIGIAFGMISTVYFWSFYGCQTPLVEVLMFFCFLFFSYYICDGIGWSGIVAAVAVGFFMDVNVVGEQKQNEQVSADISEHSAASFDSGDGELVVLMNGKDRSKPLIDRSRRKIFNRHGHLSTEARTHIGFVTEIVSTAMETAIFAYLGFFLFSHRYHWNFFHAVLAIFACCLSRAIMIPSLSFVANWITRIQQRAACRRGKRTVGVLIDKKMQIVLWIAGLRGAMSFALVEHIPLYDSFSGEGTRLKPELKAMTSASIMFTVFILGGYTNYMMQSLGIAPSSHQRNRSVAAYEVVTLTTKGLGDDIMDDEDVTETADITIGSERGISNALPGKAFRRQRVVQHGTAVLEAQSPR